VAAAAACIHCSAFIAEQAAQCGFCMNGLLMGSLAWLNRRFAAGNRGAPSDDEIASSCRARAAIRRRSTCVGVARTLRVIRAIQRGAVAMGPSPRECPHERARVISRVSGAPSSRAAAHSSSASASRRVCRPRPGFEPERPDGRLMDRGQRHDTHRRTARSLRSSQARSSSAPACRRR